MVRSVNFLFMNPGGTRDANDPSDREKLGVGVNRLYILVDIAKHELYTNVLTNDQGQVCSTNFSEMYTNFTIDGVTGEIHLGTKLHVDVDKGIQVPWFKR